MSYKNYRYLYAAAAFALGTFLSSAHAAPTLRLSDGSTTVTVVDNDPNDLDPTVGSITYVGPVGANWFANATAGASKPAQGTAAEPLLDISTNNQSSGAGTLTIEFSDDSFGPSSGTITAAIGGTLGGGAGSTYSYTTLVNPANIQFAGSTLTALGPFTQPTNVTFPFNDTTSQVFTQAGSYALTQRLVVTHTAAGTSGSDAELSLVGGSCLDLTKVADTPTAPPGSSVGYTYTVQNCGGTVLQNVVVVDDNGTPGFTGDDFTVGTVAVLGPGQSQTFHVTVMRPQNMCMMVNGKNVQVGTLSTMVQPNGDVEVIYRQSRDVVDNTYGTNASAGWTRGHKFTDLVGSDMATFKFTDGAGNVVLQFKADYVSAATSATFPSGTVSYPSGYGTLGVNGGDGGMITGSAANVLSVKTTITTDLNQSPAFYGFTTNSPAPESSFPTWDYVDGYDIVVSHNAFGANGFGGVTLPLVHDSPSKLGFNAITPTPCNDCVTNTATATAQDSTGAQVQSNPAQAEVCPGTGCSPLGDCTPPYPFKSSNPKTSIVFSESEVLRAAVVSTTQGCIPDKLELFYNDEHAMTLGVRQVKVLTKSGGKTVTTTTNYPVTPLATDPGCVGSGCAANPSPPQVGSMATIGDQAGTDVSGRPMFPSLFITDVTNNPSNPTAGDWQFGGTAIPPHSVFGTWKAAVRTVDKTRNPNVITVTPDADPAKNNWNLGPGSDPVPAGLTNQGYGAEARWNISQLGLVSGHTYRFYFMVHDGDQNKTGGDVGQKCAFITMP